MNVGDLPDFLAFRNSSGKDGGGSTRSEIRRRENGPVSRRASRFIAQEEKEGTYVIMQCNNIIIEFDLPQFEIILVKF